jgi:hypothetical protein
MIRLLRLLFAPEQALWPEPACRCGRKGKLANPAPTDDCEHLWQRHDGSYICEPCMVEQLARTDLLLCEVAKTYWDRT